MKASMWGRSSTSHWHSSLTSEAKVSMSSTAALSYKTIDLLETSSSIARMCLCNCSAKNVRGLRSNWKIPKTKRTLDPLACLEMIQEILLNLLIQLPDSDIVAPLRHPLATQKLFRLNAKTQQRWILLHILKTLNWIANLKLHHNSNGFSNLDSIDTAF